MGLKPTKVISVTACDADATACLKKFFAEEYTLEKSVDTGKNIAKILWKNLPISRI